MSEHYQYNCSNSKDCKNVYFKTPLGHASCPTWQKQVPWFVLQNANIPILKKDIEELLEFVQILKLKKEIQMIKVLNIEKLKVVGPE
jgi:hypothetical protein